MKHNLFVLALAMSLPARTLPAAAQAETLDTTRFVAIYDYECRTTDADGAPVTDHMQVVVQAGRAVTKSMPFSQYRHQVTPDQHDVAADFQEAYLHLPTVWTGYPEGQTTVRDFIFPHEFEGSEPTPHLEWTLTEDTLTVGGYLCHTATTTFRDIEWRVCYAEDIASTAGPWRLNGLPGLILRAESAAHTFRLTELRQEVTPILFELKPDIQRKSYKKLLKYRNEVFGNKRYPNEPTYYIPDVSGSIERMDVIKGASDSPLILANGHPLLTKAHVYQPLEKE